MPTTFPSRAEYDAAVARVELREEQTVLADQITNGRSVIAAVSANGRWGYEKEGRRWVVFEKTRDDALFAYETSLTAARRRTFEQDHPVHTAPRQPRPATYTVV